ncbi:MAG: hypothetical protein K6E30_07925, partial [Lachnospiraceae bacterium]|nr:hypothetical protein [Lachnospiraceae bacterium]
MAAHGVQFQKPAPPGDLRVDTFITLKMKFVLMPGIAPADPGLLRGPQRKAENINPFSARLKLSGQVLPELRLGHLRLVCRLSNGKKPFPHQT